MPRKNISNKLEYHVRCGTCNKTFNPVASLVNHVLSDSGHIGVVTFRAVQGTTSKRGQKGL